MKEKRKYGQYFTREVIAEYMVSLLSHSKTESQVLEPSCGEGVFIDKLLEAGFKQIRGYEIDERLAKGCPHVEHVSFLSVPTTEKYDVVIGNPPYIRWKNLEEELKSELKENALWNEYFNSLCDYLFVFILKSIEHLREGGEMVLICSDYWMNSTHSMLLRNYMVKNGYFERIYHFKEAPLFEGVSASFVIFKYVKTSSKQLLPIKLFTYTEKGLPTLETLKEADCFVKECIPQFKTNSRWLLASEETQREICQLERVCVKSTDLFSEELCTVGEVCDIANGMVSGLDAAFRLQDEDIEVLNAHEKANVIKVLKAKSLTQYKPLAAETYIYMMAEVNEATFVDQYPHFAKALAPHLEALNKRYSYGRKLPYWEFAFPRSKNLFDRMEPKIFVPCKERISHKSYFRFCYAPVGYYPLQDVTAIVRKKGCKESVEYLLAYLNSRYVFDWLRYNGIVKGEIVEFSETPIASIPYKRIDWSNEQEVFLHAEIVTLVQEYIKRGGIERKNQIDDKVEELLYGKNRLQATA